MTSERRSSRKTSVAWRTSSGGSGEAATSAALSSHAVKNDDDIAAGAAGEPGGVKPTASVCPALLSVGRILTGKKKNSMPLFDEHRCLPPLGPGTNFVEFISKSAGAERLRKF